MVKHIDKKSKPDSKSIARAVSQKQSPNEPSISFEDNRREAVQQKKWQDLADGSPRQNSNRGIQEMADSSVQSKHTTAQLASKPSRKIRLPDRPVSNNTVQRVGWDPMLWVGIGVAAAFIIALVKKCGSPEAASTELERSYGPPLGVDSSIAPGVGKSAPAEISEDSAPARKKGKSRKTPEEIAEADRINKENQKIENEKRKEIEKAKKEENAAKKSNAQASKAAKNDKQREEEAIRAQANQQKSLAAQQARRLIDTAIDGLQDEFVTQRKLALASFVDIANDAKTKGQSLATARKRLETRLDLQHDILRAQWVRLFNIPMPYLLHETDEELDGEPIHITFSPDSIVEGPINIAGRTPAQILYDILRVSRDLRIHATQENQDPPNHFFYNDPVPQDDIRGKSFLSAELTKYITNTLTPKVQEALNKGGDI